MKKRIILLALLIGAAGMNMLKAQKRYKAYIVSNAHLDTQWNWDVQTTIDEYLKNTLVRNFYLFNHYPNYLFNFEGGVKYNWIKEYYPLEYDLLKKYVKEGRWHIAGSSWDANDPNMPSPESFFRNILLGQQFYKKEFGVTSTDIFLPDCFGFSYTLPTIAAHCGLIGFSTQKLQWRHRNMHGKSKMPFNIGLWQGIDGSRIMAALNAKNYVQEWNGGDISTDADLKNTAKDGVNNTAYRYYGTGDRGGSASINSVVSIEKGTKGKGDVEIISASSDQLYKDYLPFDKHKELPVYNGELLMDIHATGCYTSQAAMKLYNRRNEQLGDAAERISVMANYIEGATYPASTLTDAWRRFIWHQFHDDLTGTSIPKAYTYSWNDELISQTQFNNIIHTGVGSIASCLDTRVKGSAIIIYNPMAAERKELTNAFISIPNKPAGVQVFDAKGKEVPAQLLNWQNGKAHIMFSALVSPLSCSVFDVRFKKSSKTTTLKVTKNTLENRIYKLVLDANGDIASIIDKRTSRELVEQGKAFQLALFLGNESSEWPAWEIQKSTIDKPSTKISDNVKISIEESGSCFVALRIERTYKTSKFVQYIRMSEGANDERIDILNEIDWSTKDAVLKAEFPMNVKNKEAVYDLGIGTIKRGNNTNVAYEVCAQQWADITDPDNRYGIAILNNCKYGWDKPNDNTLRLTLLHAPTTKDRYKYQETQDFGHHTFTYSIVGHVNEAQQANISHLAESLNSPLAAFSCPKHKGNLGSNYSFVKVNTPQVAVRSLKKAEESDLYIIRVYEMQGKAANNIEMEFPTSIESAYEVNGLEEKIGEATTSNNKLCFNMQAYRPKTFALRLKKGEVKASPIENTPLKLTFNSKAFTPENFGYTVSFDGKGNSFAAELIGNEITSDNITFQIGNYEEKNVIKCKGDTIQLPKESAGKKLYILAASIDKDRKTSFLVDGKPYEFDVPYYSGFYGQWGHTGVSDGYIRNAIPAYIGSHRHTEKGNDAYIFTYLYKFSIELSKEAHTLILPKDENIAVFAITMSDNYIDNTNTANEIRTLPLNTKK
ncbi:alpha-mannosidase [Bacteroidaceae bacterium HV4-6-C5C]|nr:alpha-mannosidase [Bacteroidaceae bacterium HV4-6-C5C]